MAEMRRRKAAIRDIRDNSRRRVRSLEFSKVAVWPCQVQLDPINCAVREAVFRTLCDLDLHIGCRPGCDGRLVAVYQVAKVLNGSRATKIVTLPLST